MSERIFDQQTQRERTHSLINGAGRAGAKIACAGVSVLMASQLMLPCAALANETTDAITSQDTPAMTVTLGTTTTAEAEAIATETPSPAADPAPAAMPTVAATPAATPAASPEPAAADPAAPAPADPAPASPATPQANTPQPCGVTDVIEGEGGVKINTTVVDHYYDCTLPPALTLNEGESQTFDLADAPDAMVSMLKADTRYFKADNATHALVEATNAAGSAVTLSITPVENRLRVTLTFTGGEVDSGAGYSLNLSSSEKIGSTLTYTGTDYEGGDILVGDPDDIFNGNYRGGSVIINETRDNYYLRYGFDSTVTLVSAEAQAIQTAIVENAKLEYAPGEAPRATATVPAAYADKYEIAYECWELMEGDDPANLTPVAFWYSDDSKYTPGMERIARFEEGKFYMYSVELRLKDGNEFAPDVDATVNGAPANYVIHTVNGLFLPNAGSMLCEEPIDEWQAIDVIEVTGATTTFKAGDKPVFTAGTPGGSSSLFQCEYWMGSDGSDANSVDFWDQNITNRIGTFKPGVTYRYGVYLKAARGFYFTPSTKLVINGVEHGYEVADSVSDPENGWIYTLWLSTDIAFAPEAANPNPETKPSERPGDNGNGPVESDKPTQAVDKTAEKALPTTGDDTMLAIATLGVAGATVAAAGIAVGKRREE